MPTSLDKAIAEADAATAQAPVAVPITAGRMIVDLEPNGTSRPFPRVSFEPVGLFTPGLIHDNLMLMAHACEKAHALTRAEARKGDSK